MHAFFLTRGIKKDVDEMIKFLETRTMILPYAGKDGKRMQIPIQGNLQPIQLWSYVFPENEKDKVLTTLKFDQEGQGMSSRRMKILVEGLRMAMNAKKIPPFSRDRKLMMPNLDNIAITPIGVNYDPTITFPDGTIQEAI